MEIIRGRLEGVITFHLVYFKYTSMFIRATQEGLKTAFRTLKMLLQILTEKSVTVRLALNSYITTAKFAPHTFKIY